MPTINKKQHIGTIPAVAVKSFAQINQLMANMSKLWEDRVHLVDTLSSDNPEQSNRVREIDDSIALMNIRYEELLPYIEDVDLITYNDTLGKLELPEKYWHECDDVIYIENDDGSMDAFIEKHPLTIQMEMSSAIESNNIMRRNEFENTARTKGNWFNRHYMFTSILSGIIAVFVLSPLYMGNYPEAGFVPILAPIVVIIGIAINHAIKRSAFVKANILTESDFEYSNELIVGA